MAIVRFDPFAMLDDFDNLIRTSWSENAPVQTQRWVPAVNMRTVGSDVEIELELPGLKREDIDVEVHEKRLSVSGERRETRSAEDGSTLLREMRYGSFSREFRLPDTVAADQVSADYADGILRLHIAGVKPAPAEPHKIQVDERPAGVSVTATDQAEVESAE